ncbi:hypothetical protein ACFSSA_06655 [Luteolibacter algae]|uniref:Uncharacterized protein n=1 Tax=Luteolibacter algae TaxID=454151 RepID=A0ABW5D663_9BACT
MSELKNITAIEATVIRSSEPVRHHFWCVFHDWHTPYIIVDLPEGVSSSGKITRHEARILVREDLNNTPHPNGNPNHLYRDVPFFWAENEWVPVEVYRNPSDCQERISPEDFHLDPEKAKVLHRDTVNKAFEVSNKF